MAQKWKILAKNRFPMKKEMNERIFQCFVEFPVFDFFIWRMFDYCFDITCVDGSQFLVLKTFVLRKIL